MLKKIHIENFTAFENIDLEFCPGVNVFIGTNATGKSHLLKIIYGLTRAIPANRKTERNDTDILRYYGELNGLFRPQGEGVNDLIRSRDRKTPAVFELESEQGFHFAELRRDYHIAVGGGIPPNEDEFGLFIPPNEVLAIYPGFIASYEKRELAFDKTYYDICKALSAAPLRSINNDLSRLLESLREIIQGNVIQKGDHFYVENTENELSLEAHLVAEGHRKISTIIHLINNGSLSNDTVLFWDEPEANLNPRIINLVARFLRELAKTGVQVFIATHDYLLTGELSVAVEYQATPQVPIRFFAFSRENPQLPVKVEMGESLSDLNENPILDEFAAHYDREQEMFKIYSKRENI